MIIFKDGVKYLLWEPEHELNDFEPMIKYHVKDIFGDECEYFPKQKLKTLADIRSIPDGFVVDFQRRKWYIVELKLLRDDAINRISGQIVDYKNAIRNDKTRRKIYKAMKSIKDVNFLDDLINEKEPEIVIIINNLNGIFGKKFKEKVKGTEEKVIIFEFKTFTREGVDPKKVHIHLFEPLCKPKIDHLPKSPILPVTLTSVISTFERARKAKKVTFQELNNEGLVKDGQILYFYHTRLFPDEQAVIIVSSNMLRYMSDGKLFSSSKLAKALLIKYGFKKDDHDVAGPRYWKTKDGKLLHDLNEQVRAKRGDRK